MSIEAARLKVTVGADIDGAQRGLGQVDKSIGSMVRGAGQSLLGFLGRDIALAAGRAGMALVGVGMDYESSLNTFQAVSSANVGEMDRVRATAKLLGNDLTLPATSAADATSAMTELAKAGMDVNESLGASKGTLQLAAAAQTDEANAAKITANALNAYEIAASDAGKVSDILAASSNASSAEITDLADSLQMASAVAHMANVDLDDTATALAELANKGIKGSDAGTSVKQMLLSLLSPSQEAKRTMEQFGLSVYDAQGKVRPMRDLVGEFSTKLGGLSEEQRNAALSTIFGSDAVRAANIVLMDGTAAWDEMNEAVNRSGAAQELAEAKSKGLRGALDALQSQVETVAIGFYEKAGPAVEDFVRDLATGLPGALDAAGDFFIVLWDKAGPTLIDIADLTGDLVGFLVDVADAGQPIATVFLAIAGSGILITLQGVLAVVGPIASFLNDNALAAELFAMGLGAIAASKGISALVNLGSTVLDMVAIGLYNATGKAAGLRTALAGINTTAAAIGIGAAVALSVTSKTFENADAKGRKLLETLERPKDFTSWDELNDYLNRVGVEWSSANEVAKEGDGIMGAVKETMQGLNPVWANTITDATTATKLLGGEMDELLPRLDQWNVNLAAGARETGLTREQYQQLANTLGVDLTAGGAAGQAAMQAVADKAAEMAASTGHSVQEIGTAVGGSAEDMERLAEEAQELRDAMKSSFDSATSIVQAFAGETDISAKDVMAHFAEMVEAARNWSTNLQELAHAGIDQGLLEELAIAGPESAALVSGLLDAVRSGNVDAINMMQAHMRESLGLAQQAVIDAKTGYEVAGWNNGVAAAQGTIDGLDASASAIYATAAAIAANVAAAMQRAAANPKSIPFMPNLYGAEGGIFDEATPIIIGEAGKEVLLPLTDPRRTAELAQASGLYDVLAAAGAIPAMADPVAPVSSRHASQGGSGGTLTLVAGDVMLDGQRVGQLILHTVEEGLRDTSQAGGDLGYRP